VSIRYERSGNLMAAFVKSTEQVSRKILATAP
jgi:hypothetical protein